MGYIHGGKVVARALRAWSLSNPAEYALLYGTPVPGYVAPADTNVPATRPVLVLVSILADAHPPAGGAGVGVGSGPVGLEGG